MRITFPGMVASGDVVPFAWGITKVSRQAEAVGSTAVPDPETDLASWLWYHAGTVKKDTESGGGGRADSRVISLDIRSKRRLDDRNDHMVLCFKNMDAGDNIAVHFDGRFLIGV